MARAIRVLIVDDHPVVREGLELMLGRRPNLAVVGQAADGWEALEQARRLKPDVILMDLRLPRMDGVEATRRVREECPQARVLVLTTYDQDELVLAGLRAGAAGYLLKDSPREDIFRAIEGVHRGETVLHPSVAAQVVEHATAGPAAAAAPSPLSQREREALHCLSDGLSNREIAARLGIAESTVKTHLANLFAKLGVSDRTEAVTTAIRQGWLRLR
ncbi:MAG: response regulator transcription factor [bacterium]|nr:response regulator transcription factor [bacterium]